MNRREFVAGIVGALAVSQLPTIATASLLDQQLIFFCQRQDGSWIGKSQHVVADITDDFVHEWASKWGARGFLMDIGEWTERLWMEQKNFVVLADDPPYDNILLGFVRPIRNVG